MRRQALALLLSMAATPALAQDPEPPVAPTARPRPADADAPLPDGWPAATEAGEVRVKAYPPYRSAVARAKGARPEADNVLFFPLFTHIQRREIAMTAPVVNTYEPAMLDRADVEGAMSMEFLYRTASQGEVGPGVGAVKVVDHPAATYACLGYRGVTDPARLRVEFAKLKAWLAEHGKEWTPVEGGEPRRLDYHGPSTPEADRLWEIQVPVRPATR